MRYTIELLITFMREKPSIFGWNAIVAYDRPKANKGLAQEYVQRFSQGEGYMPKLTGQVPVTEAEIEYVYDYLMDAPQLLFEDSTITSSKALLTVRVPGGSQFTLSDESGRGLAVNKVGEYEVKVAPSDFVYGKIRETFAQGLCSIANFRMARCQCSFHSAVANY